MEDESPRLAGFYGRVSGTDDESIYNQLAIAREVAASEGYEIPNGLEYLYEDVHVSGTTKRRRGFDRLIGDIRAGEVPFDRLYIRATDRLGRWSDPRMYDYFEIEFEMHGVTIRFCDAQRHLQLAEGVDDADVGMYLSNKVDAINGARERTRIIRKMRRAKRLRVLKGFYPGARAPYGFDRVLVDKDTREVLRVVEPGERVYIDGYRVTLQGATDRRRDAVRFVFDSIEHGRSYLWIEHELNARGFPPPTPEKPWHRSIITKMAQNPLYMGRLVWGRWKQQLPTTAIRAVEVDSQDPIQVDGYVLNAPISPDQFARVRDILDGRSALWNRRRACSPRYLLTAKVRCSLCGENLYGNTLSGSPSKQTREKHKYPYYAHFATARESKAYACSQYGLRIRRERLENAVLEEIRSVLGDPNLEALVRAEVEQSLTGREQLEAEFAIDELRKEIKSVEDRMERLEDDLEALESDTGRTRLQKRIDRLGSKVDGMRRDLHEREAARDTLAQRMSFRARLIADAGSLVEQLDSGDFQLRRAVVERVLEYVEVHLTTSDAVICIRYQ